jgi:hypothetical protein
MRGTTRKRDRHAYSCHKSKSDQDDHQLAGIHGMTPFTWTYRQQVAECNP